MRKRALPAFSGSRSRKRCELLCIGLACSTLKSKTERAQIL